MDALRRRRGFTQPVSISGLARRVGFAMVAVLFLNSLTTDCKATLIATDHFFTGNPADPAAGEYQLTQFRRSNANGAGQDPTIPGFTGPWTGNVTSGTSFAVAQWTAAAGAIESGLPFAEGDRARFSGVDNFHRRVQRELAAYTPNDTYYMSFTSQVLTGDTDLDGFVGIGFTNVDPSVGQTDDNLTGGSALRGLLIGASADGSVTNYVVRHVGSTGALQDDVILSDIPQNVPGTTSPYIRHTIVKLEFNDDPGNAAGNSKITIWQDPTDLSSEANATASVTPLEFRTFALDSTADMTHLMMTGIDYSRPASWDEPRLATTWASVTSVPEPSTIAVAVFALTMVGMRRMSLLK